MSRAVPAVRVALDGVLLTGRGIDLPPDAPPVEEIRRAIRQSGGVRDGPSAGRPVPITVDCPRPGPGHATLLAPASPPTGVTGLLAAAARSRGIDPPQQADLEAAEAALAAVEPTDSGTDSPDPDLRAARVAVATAGCEVDRLRERVATLRGHLQARRATDTDADANADEVARALRAAAAALSEAETERLAAEQTHEAAARRARRARGRRAERLRRQDRVDNLRRAARRDLAVRVHDDFAEALAAVPGTGRAGDRPAAYHGDPVTAALAAVRVADLDAPVVDATGKFPDAAAAVACLDVPVLRC